MLGEYHLGSKVCFFFLNVIFFAGGGVALLYATKELAELQTDNFDQKIGVQIIQNALKVCVSSFRTTF